MLSTGPAARGSFEFDCIDADYADDVGGAIEGAFNEDKTKPFATVRIVTTPHRFEEVAGALGLPGNWFLLEIGPQKKPTAIPTWHAQLQPNGLLAHSRGVTRRISFIGSDRDGDPHRPTPRSLGAAVTKQATVPTIVIAACALRTRPGAARHIARVLGGVTGVTALRVRDVGQASFSSLCDKDGRALIHYDVGFPISFNGHTSPKYFDLDESEKPPVVLSHWDWDHLHAAFLFPHLMDCFWIVPDQKLGPGAARLAQILAAKGRLLVHRAGTLTNFPNGEVAHASGPGASPNDSGLTARVTLASGRSVLLTGDVDYRFLSHPGTRPVDHLVATHHGARFASSRAAIPLPVSGAGSLLLSYGNRNVYRHPHPDALNLHTGAGWANQISTARNGVLSRGDREVD